MKEVWRRVVVVVVVARVDKSRRASCSAAVRLDLLLAFRRRFGLLPTLLVILLAVIAGFLSERQSWSDLVYC